MPTIVLVGYTNAGKSTLFNALTSAGVLAEDRLFATLDPTLRKLLLEGFGEVVLADTVGFIRNLPLDLVDAFKATLEEVAEADLLLHVIDCAADDVLDTRIEVLDVLRDIGAAAVPVIEVYNKIDQAGLFERVEDDPIDSRERVPHYAGGAAVSPGREPAKVFVSAKDGIGIDGLREAMGSALGVDRAFEVRLGPASGRVRAWLYRIGAVVNETTEEDGGSRLRVRLDAQGAEQLMAESGVSLQGYDGAHKLSLLP